MAPKRKREVAIENEPFQHENKRFDARDPPSPAPAAAQVVIQIIAGSYDRVLHGLTARIASTAEATVDFADTFLFDAHTSAIRCLAVSPPSAPLPGQSQNVMLATGGTDERINVYTLSAHPPRSDARQQLISSLTPRPVLENPKNRELGSLLHHSSSITKLHFPTRSKLISASEDSTIAVTRTRDWSLLSAIKTPIPKAWGRPSGDTAPLGSVPSGVNDFAVHPSMKLMISVSKGERCMRLWNLITGKKAGVLNFDKAMLYDMGEGKPSSMGEGRSVVWGISDDHDEFAVAFDREIIVYGMNGTPRCKVMGSTRTKIHRVRYVRLGRENAVYLAVSTEDGRICLHSTQNNDLRSPGNAESTATGTRPKLLPVAKLVGIIGGRVCGITGRIKDFVALPVELETGTDNASCIVISGCSDGRIGVWRLTWDELATAHKSGESRQVGKLIGTYETQNRITCITAFEMISRSDATAQDSGEEYEDEDDHVGVSDEEV